MRIRQILSDFNELSRAGEAPPQLRGRLLGIALWSSTVMVLLGVVLVGGFWQSPPPVRLVQFGTLALVALNWWLWRRGAVDLSANILVWGFWGLVSLVVLSEGGRTSHWLVPQFLLIILARFIIHGRAAIFLAILTVVFDLAIFAVDLHILLPPEWHELALGADWAAIAISSILLLFILYIADLVLQEVLDRSRLTEGRYQFLFENTNDIIIIVSPEQTVINVNKLAADLLGYQPDEMIGRPYIEFVAPDQKRDVEQNFDQLGTAGISPLFERVLICKDGSRRSVEFNAASIKDERGRVMYYQGVGRDLTERKRLEEQLRVSLADMEALAMQDSLTGLLNRRAITDHAEAEWHRSLRDRRPMCVILIDLDNLKGVNDSLGHLVGDKVIRLLATVIKTSLRRYDWAGRWGGDEFLLVLPGTNLVDAQEIAERLRNHYSSSPLIAEMDAALRPYLSIGMAVFSGRPGDETNTSQLFGQADNALYMAKQKGKNRVEIYRDE